jgi:hypothetical protein
MLNIRSDAPVAVTVIEAIHNGAVESLQRLLNENPGLVTARLVDRFFQPRMSVCCADDLETMLCDIR